jgi:hypothetical protein
MHQFRCQCPTCSGTRDPYLDEPEVDYDPRYYCPGCGEWEGEICKCHELAPDYVPRPVKRPSYEPTPEGTRADFEDFGDLNPDDIPF